MKKLVSVLTAFCLILSVCSVYLSASAAETEILATYHYSGGEPGTDMDVSLGGKKDGYFPTSQVNGIGSLLFASVSGVDGRKLEWSKDLYKNGDNEDYVAVMTGGTKNPWGSSPYFLLTFSTKGYRDIAFTAKLGGTKKGPRDYKLQYSLDGEAYMDVPDAAYRITNNKKMELAFDSVSIAEIADKDRVYLKIISFSEYCIDNGELVFTDTTSGETAINDIIISGVKISGGDDVLIGDVDNDGKITVSDVVMLRSLIMKGDYTVYQFKAGDLDKSEDITVSDVVALRTLIMKGSA